MYNNPLSRVPVDAFECIIFCAGYNLKVATGERQHFYVGIHSQIQKVLEKQFCVPI